MGRPGRRQIGEGPEGVLLGNERSNLRQREQRASDVGRRQVREYRLVGAKRRKRERDLLGLAARRRREHQLQHRRQHRRADRVEPIRLVHAQIAREHRALPAQVERLHRVLLQQLGRELEAAEPLDFEPCRLVEREGGERVGGVATDVEIVELCVD